MSRIFHADAVRSRRNRRSRTCPTASSWRPLTRNRSSGAGRVPNALMRDYYVQRASAGLIISEATSVEPRGVGYPHTPGHLVGRAGRGLAARHRRPCTRPAAGSSCSSGMSGAFRTRATTTARRRSAPSAIARAGPCQPAAARSALTRAARAGDRRNPRHRRGLSPGRGKRESGRLRRRRDPRRQRLSARPVPAGRQQQAHGPLRRIDREPRAADARGRRRRDLGLGRGPGRHASGAARRRARHGRQRSRRDLRLCRRANSAGARSPSCARANP